MASGYSGDIGPKAGLPVMEGKALLFKRFANIDTFPICIDSQDTNKIVETVMHITPVFGGINLEDIPTQLQSRGALEGFGHTHFP